MIYLHALIFKTLEGMLFCIKTQVKDFGHGRQGEKDRQSYVQREMVSIIGRRWEPDDLKNIFNYNGIRGRHS